jgi:hypothetical protein
VARNSGSPGSGSAVAPGIPWGPSAPFTGPKFQVRRISRAHFALRAPIFMGSGAKSLGQLTFHIDGSVTVFFM